MSALPFSISFGHPFALLFLTLLFQTLSAEQSSSFSFTEFDVKDLNFKSNVDLFGDAKVDNGGSWVQLTGSDGSSSGQLVYNKPIKVVQGNRQRLAFLSTTFSFSLSAGSRDGLAFVLFPSWVGSYVFGNGSFGLSLGKGKVFNGVVAVEFDTNKDADLDDLNTNHVGIDVGSLVSVKVSNMSSHKLVLNSGDKLQAWVDYEASSRRLEVRLSKFGDSRPSDPVLWYLLDVWELWKDEDVLLGLSSSSKSSNQTCLIYSWSFKLRNVPQFMHSEPVNPDAVSKETKMLRVKEKNDCVLKILAAMIFGTGSGALGAFIVLYLWSIFGNRRPVVPEEFAAKPLDCEYKKVNVVVDKPIKDDQ